jgi:hypothetical protein
MNNLSIYDIVVDSVMILGITSGKFASIVFLVLTLLLALLLSGIPFLVSHHASTIPTLPTPQIPISTERASIATPPSKNVPIPTTQVLEQSLRQARPPAQINITSPTNSRIENYTFTSSYSTFA